MNPISTRITGTSAQLKPVKSERSCRPRSGKPSAATKARLHDASCAPALRVDVVRPAAPQCRIERVRAARRRVRRSVGVNAQEERCTGAVCDPSARDVSHARARRSRPRHDDLHAGALQQRPQSQAHLQVELGLAQSAHDSARAATVLDLAHRRAGPDRLRLRVRPQVVAGIDDDDDARLRFASRDGDGEQSRSESEGEPAPHVKPLDQLASRTSRSSSAGGPRRLAGRSSFARSSSA